MFRYSKVLFCNSYKFLLNFVGSKQDNQLNNFDKCTLSIELKGGLDQRLESNLQ